jgi:uncharacterized membrane protein YhaH (DUF805 family)
MNDNLLWDLILFVVLLIIVMVGVFFLLRFLLRKIIRDKSCSTVFFQFVGGIALFIGGFIFLIPGLEMTKAFADMERSAGANVVFEDAPFFLGSPEAWIFLGIVMIVGGIYSLYVFFKE